MKNKADKTKCFYCEREFKKGQCSRLTRDHVVPYSRGGLSCAPNKVFACAHCNGLKADCMLEEFIIKLKFHILAEQRYKSLTASLLQIVLQNAQELLIEVQQTPRAYRRNDYAAHTLSNYRPAVKKFKNKRKKIREKLELRKKIIASLVIEKKETE